MNTFKNQTECLRDYEQRFITMNRVPVQEAVTKTVPNKKEFKKEKQLSEQPLQIAEETRKAKSKRERQKAKEKGKDLPNQMQSSREQQGEIRRPS